MSTQRPATATRDDKPTVHHWTHDYDLVHLDDDAWEIIRLVAAARSASYEDGRTTDVLLGEGETEGKHVTGVAGEVAASIALGYRPLEAVDLSASADGDDGRDIVIRDGPGERSIDVKAHWSMPVDSPSQLVVQQSKVEEEQAGVYVMTQVWDAEWAVVHGWTWRDRLVREGREETWDKENYVLSADKLWPISSLRGRADGLQWEA